MISYKTERMFCVYVFGLRKGSDKMNTRNQKKMPDLLRELLLREGRDEESVLFYSAVDLTREGLFGPGYVVLTAKGLEIWWAPADEENVHCYKGSERSEELQQLAFPELWQSSFYELAQLEKIWIENGVGCNLLIARTSQGEQCLAMFTHAHKKRMSQLVKLLEQLQQGEEAELPEEKEERCPKCGRMYPDQVRKICPHCTDRKSIFFRVLGYFKPYRVQFGVMFLCTLLTAALNLVWPYLNGTILYDYVLAKNEPFLQKLGIENGDFVVALFMLVVTMAVTKIMLLLLQILHGVLTANMVVGVVRDMKKSVFRNMGQLSISFYRSRQTGGLMTRVMSDADRITGFFVDGAPYVLIHGFTIIASLVVMFGINPMMTLVSVALFPVLVAVSVYLRPKIWIMYGRRHRAERSVNSGVNDNLSGARVVKSFGQERREMERFKSSNSRLREAEIAIAYRQNYFSVVYGATQSFAALGVWIIGSMLLLGGKDNAMDLGLLITFLSYVGQMEGPMNFFSRIHNWWADSMNSAQRIFEIIDAVPEIQEAEEPIALTAPRGEILLDKVTFGYEVNRPVLKNVSLHIPAGSMIGIVGRSGAGKTTLVNLISRMYDTQEGSISIDGIDVKQLSFKELRKNVAMVSQDTYIFMGTVAENIAYAEPTATRMEIMRAAKLAGAHEFIMRMPDGYDTRIGASGRELSGGEKQRISIARAVLANPKILILDEATASVDTETERVIQKSINYLVKGRTTISIAHRLSTLRDADYLVVIDNGEITERGTHKELEALKGTYYKLSELQTKALALKSEVV